MEKKNLLIAGILAGIIVVLIGIWPIIFPYSTSTDDSITAHENTIFNSKTPEEKAIFVAKLNDGLFGFESDIVKSASLSPDKKYWIVTMEEAGDYGGVFTVDPKTLMSKQNDGEWRSFDELKASYIAEIQIRTYGDGGVERPYKTTIDGKEIWKVPVYIYKYNENSMQMQDEYVYVDLATGKSKNTAYEFNEAAGTDNWLTLAEVDNTINKIGYSKLLPFRDALRDIYPK